LFKVISNIFINWLTDEQPVEGFPKCDFEKLRYEIRPCDVLLIEGRSRVSEVIKTITQSPWSHSVLYLGRLHDIEDEAIRETVSKFYKGKANVQLILEGVIGKGTIVTPLSTYKKDHIRICRPRGLSQIDSQNVIKSAVSKLGTDYDVRQIFDLARFLLPWSIFPRRWRSNLFQHGVGESTRTVCSTVIAEAFNAVDFPILPYVKLQGENEVELIHRNPKLYTPSDFDYSPYFEIIKYPFIAFDDHAMYRKLPWNRDGTLSHDEHRYKPAAYSESVSNIENDAKHIPEMTATDHNNAVDTDKLSTYQETYASVKGKSTSDKPITDTTGSKKKSGK